MIDLTPVPDDFCRALQALMSRKERFALLRLPTQSMLHIMVDDHKLHQKAEPDLSLVPFIPTQTPLNITFRARLTCLPHALATSLVNLGLLTASELAATALEQVAPSPSIKAQCRKLNAAAQERYEKAFSHFTRALSSGRLQKLVLARPYYCQLRRPVAQTLWHLLQHYPQACVYFIYVGNGKFYLAATPETLAVIEGKRLKTMSLAGTMAKDPGANYLWSKKNKHEQQLVTDYIVQVLKPYSQDIALHGPHTHDAGPVVHLCTQIEATLKDKVNPAAVIAALHPTPAVCGIPTVAAMDFICKHEGLLRDYYAGYIAFKDESAWRVYVNLRCLYFDGTMACLYAGGGIVPGSVLNAEWQETVNKLKALQELL